MIRLLIPIAMLVIGWITFLILVRRNEKKVESEWTALLSPASEKIYEQARLDMETNTAMVGVAMGEALEVRQLGDVEEAIRFLNIGADIIQRFTPNLLSLLAVMAKFSRMVSAISPVNPILPSDFHLAELASLAHLHRILHHMLASTKQRFRLKLYVLGKGLSITSHYLLKKIRGIVVRQDSDDQEWREIIAVEEDFQRLSEESIESFRCLMAALSSDAAKELSRTLSLPSPSEK